MSPSTEQRKLAAIMFTDMVGYSALAQRNEKLALGLLAEQQLLLRSTFPKFNGREIKSTGDGFLVEFTSALEAAQCAVEIQKSLVEYNASAAPERRIQVRIGVHLGDVVLREADMFGDGVNIAARIEPLAEAGGICLSGPVVDQVANKLGVSLVKLGAPELKNIRTLVDVYRVVLPWEGGGTAGRPSATKSKPRSNLSRVLLPGGAVLILLTIASVWLHMHQPGGTPSISSGPANEALKSATPLPDQKSIAVLPFVNMSSDKENEYLSDGITEELCTALAQVRGLRVPARTSCFVFKGKTDDIQKIGQQLHVATVLEGSVSKSGNKLRITAQLINIADGFHLWATNYDRDVSDLLALRSEIAQQVVAAMRVQLLPGEKEHLEKKGTENPEAHRLYLVGLSLWNQRTEEGINKALDYFGQALLKDSNYSLPHVGVADCYLTLPFYSRFPTKQAIPHARAAALAALTLDDRLGEAHAALAYVRRDEWDWQGADAEFKHALTLSPNYATAHKWYSDLLLELRRFDEASREIQRAQELDPLSPIINSAVGWVLHNQGYYDQAITACRAALELHPRFFGNHLCLGQTYLMKQMYREAITEFQGVTASVENAPLGLGHLGYAYAMSGRPNEAREVLDQLTGFLQRGYGVQCEIALIYHGLGDRENALNWLEKGVEAHLAPMPQLNYSPAWQNLRSEPRFLALLKTMGLEK
jgi:TolB-like protein/class 3 adenylate cyclase/Flp pilus assembly protein TadD